MLTHEEAAAECVSRKGVLASINTHDESYFIKGNRRRCDLGLEGELLPYFSAIFNFLKMVSRIYGGSHADRSKHLLGRDAVSGRPLAMARWIQDELHFSFSYFVLMPADATILRSSIRWIRRDSLLGNAMPTPA